jgi:antitoxin FitA
VAVLTIRRLDDAVKARLRIRAAQNGRSMEEEARLLLEESLATPREQPKNLAQAIRDIMAPLGGVELEIPPRGPGREPPDFRE